MKKIGLRYLHETGILFEINRQILNPLGMMLSFKPAGTSDEEDTCVLVETDDSEGFLFPETAFSEGAAKFSLYLKTIGNARLERRMKTKGFIRQTRSDQ